jgi:glycosyltransferase involved in cell wall biosynthesis/GT2 family glycosyltransferase
MARVALPSYDVQTVGGRAGGVGAFVTRLARHLRADGDEVTIIATRSETHSIPVDRLWREKYRAWGIEVVEVHNKPPPPDRWPEVWSMRLSEEVAPLLRAFDVVYLSDWANVGFQTLRVRRFGATATPVCVTVLHGSSGWHRPANRREPIVPDDLNLAFVERYCALHSDFVVAPSRWIVDWAKQEGWRFRREPEVLGLPYWEDRAPAPGRAAARLSRLVFFGRLEPRKGYDLFVAALQQLMAESPEVLQGVQEVVLLGHEDLAGAADRVRRDLAPAGLRVTHLGGLDSDGAHDYLVARAADALVVVASPFENLPYAVIEASLVPGLNIICSRGGGTPEIFGGHGDAQLFDPLPGALATKIRERLVKPLAPDGLARYDFEAANQRWLAFHRRVRDHAEMARAPRAASGRSADAVDVCVTYYNKGRHFPQLCEALSRQTTQAFRVIAVDDGSPDPESVAVFDRMAEQHRGRGWTFIRQPHRSVDAARNEAARRGQAEYVIMIDGDDVVALKAVERMLEAARRSGDDYLVAWAYLFAGDGFPYDLATGAPTAPIIGYYTPLGASIVAGLLDPIVFGGPMVIMRRQAFEAVGGYREMAGAAHGDWELHARLALGGYKTDVLPEYLHFYRQLDDGLSRRANRFASRRRIIEAYERHLAEAGLRGMADAMVALYRQRPLWPPGLRVSEPVVARAVRRLYHMVPLRVRLRMRLRQRAMELIARLPPA